MTHKDSKPTVVFDISRTISGANREFVTGIGRVERAYLEHLLKSPDPVLFLARFKAQSALLNQQSMRALYSLIQQKGPWDKPKFSALSSGSKGAPVRATVRRLAIAWPFLGRGLKTHAPNGFIYLNVGHEKLVPSLWRQLRRNGAVKIIVMIHDLIPIDFPQFATAKSTANFASRMQVLTQNANFFIYNSSDTEQRMQHWFKKWGTYVDGRVVLLGTDPLPFFDHPPPSAKPYFVYLSTIEPRKNHKLLLDIWTEFHDTLPESEIPHLHIVGRRGWLNEEVINILDTAAFMGNTVFEHNKMPDEQLGPLMKGARALLFPSFTEGFGFPLVEALQMQVPVICSNLPCFFEIAGDAPTYISPENQREWRDEIYAVATSDGISLELSKKPPELPTWHAHFHNIDTILTDIN